MAQPGIDFVDYNIPRVVVLLFLANLTACKRPREVPIDASPPPADAGSNSGDTEAGWCPLGARERSKSVAPVRVGVATRPPYRERWCESSGGRSHGPYERRPFVGWSGETIEGRYFEGEKQGRWLKTYGNGQSWEEQHFDRGKRHGRQRLWSEKGQLVEDESYTNDRLDGRQRRWLLDGRLVLDLRWTAGRHVPGPGDICRSDLMPLNCPEPVDAGAAPDASP